jgi:hypothetical protein
MRLNMQVRKPWLLVVAALQLGNFAYADDATCPADGTASSIVYEGKDTQGEIVRLTTPDVSVASIWTRQGFQLDDA